MLLKLTPQSEQDGARWYVIKNEQDFIASWSWAFFEMQKSEREAGRQTINYIYYLSRSKMAPDGL